ncbi:aldo/keto reductase [Salsipaludibacter albus]|uniref:aldo/keto reductase n=1 Tax=Salsipaludibacter albus TaxID=2849650 RepID=UPI001EE455DC|nr:aldo/keto reductase [Salsipaludibacter albus]MBY5164318.1 aldo/keto reductase [Salsipaludibacter albus]
MSTTTAPTVTAHGITMPALGFGTFELDEATAEQAVTTALEVGYRHVDTAVMYDNEAGVGRALAASGVDRDAIFVTTKIRPRNAAAADVTPEIEASLARLDLDHVDLVLLHWPNDDVPVEETVEALHAAQERGLTRTFGISNHPTDLMRRAAAAGPVFTNQVEYHPFLDQSAVVDAARELAMTVTAYSPVARGGVFDDDTLGEIAANHDASAGRVALRWLLDQDGVAAVPRSSDPDHIADNLAVDLSLTADETARIDALPKDRRLIDPPFAPDWD